MVESRADSQVGLAQASSAGTVGHRDLAERPLLRVGELLEAVPGVIAVMHSGGGKANQYFVRGFDLDHGTDFAVAVDGVGVNLPGHTHSHGYADLNPLIPELVERIDYKKGPYFADIGDFGSAGGAGIQTYDRLPQNFATVEVGSFNWLRAAAGHTQKFDHALFVTAALDASTYDGPWTVEEDARRTKGLLKFGQGTRDHGWTITLHGYRGDWRGTDQVPQRAIDQGLIGRYGSLDNGIGGRSTRFGALASWRTGAAGTPQTAVTAYAQRYFLQLFLNNTIALDDPVGGDQLEQGERRWLGGVRVTHRRPLAVAGIDTELQLGIEGRHDAIGKTGLYTTIDRERTATVREDRVAISSGAMFVEDQQFWTDWLRTTVGVRGDAYRFGVDSDNDANDGERTAALASPKGSVVLGPWAKTELYLNAGLGFHSNSAAGVVQQVEPGTTDAVDSADPLVRSTGAEIGLRTTAVRGLHSTVSLYWLTLDRELLFVGDAGSTEESPARSRRVGFEINNHYTPSDWLDLDVDYAMTWARYTKTVESLESDGSVGEGRKVPRAIPWVLTGGVTVRPVEGAYAGVKVRWFARRPLNESGSVESTPSLLVNARIGYAWRGLEGFVEVLNLLDRHDDDAAFFYESQLPGETPATPGPDGGQPDIHRHPMEPFALRAGVSFRY